MILDQSENNKRIAKNTLLLYFRMFFTMAVTLYTSRVILKALGVEDFGIYNVVAGIVTLFSFFSGALSSAASRFISFELGSNNTSYLSKVFSAIFIIHLLSFCCCCLFCRNHRLMGGKLQIDNTTRKNICRSCCLSVFGFQLYCRNYANTIECNDNSS